MRLTITSTPSISPIAQVNALPSARPRRSSERGPCTASSANSSETSRTSEPGTSRSLTSGSRARDSSVDDQQVAVLAPSDRRSGRRGSRRPRSSAACTARRPPSASRRRSTERLEQVERVHALDLPARPCATRRRRRQSERTARCSGITPSYCTGISQPAKGTIRAPSRHVALEERRTAEASAPSRPMLTVSLGRDGSDASADAALRAPRGAGRPDGPFAGWEMPVRTTA